MAKIAYKIPIESADYPRWSAFALKQIRGILKERLVRGANKIFIRTNLKRGLSLENINKKAGPFVEVWALEVFDGVNADPSNRFHLVHVEAGARLDPYDIILQFKRRGKAAATITSYVDAKATAEDIPGSGRSPNITSFKRIRSAYVEDPDYMFVILSLKHKVYAEKSGDIGMTNGVMEIVSYHAYDLKYLSDKDISYNPSLGTGQIQVRDIHYVTLVSRNVWEFCQILDRKFMASKGKGEAAFMKMAAKEGWIK